MRKITTLFFTGLAFLGIAAFGCAGFDQETFSATLDQAQEVPPTGVTATGTFSIIFEGPHASYTLTIGGGGLAGITRAHIHGAAAAGVNGNVWVYLFDGPDKDATLFTGKLGTGSFTQEMVAACAPGCSGGSFNNLLNGARASTTYVNVHTATFTGGAIRGQIHP